MRNPRAGGAKSILTMAWALLAAASCHGATLLEEHFEDERALAAKGAWVYGKPTFAKGRTGNGIVIDAKNSADNVRPGVSFPAGRHFCLDGGAVEMWVKPFADGDGLGTAYLFSTRETQLVGEREWNRNRIVLYTCSTGYRRSDHLLFFVIWDRERKPRRVWANVTSWKRNEWHKIRAEWTLDDGAGKCRMALVVDGKIASSKPDNDAAIRIDRIGDWLDIGHRRHERGNVGQFWGVIDDLKIEGQGRRLPPTDALDKARALQAGAPAAIDWTKAVEVVVNGDFEQVSAKAGTAVGWRVPTAFCSVSEARARSGKRSLRVSIPWHRVKQLRRTKGRSGPHYYLDFGHRVHVPPKNAVRGRFVVDVYAETAVPWFRIGTPCGGHPIECVADKRLPIGKWVRLSREAMLPAGKTTLVITFVCVFTERYGVLEKGETATLYIDCVGFKIAGG